MKKRYFASIVVFICCITLSYGQSVPFLHYFSDARTSAMGGMGYVVPTPYAVQYNIATVVQDHSPTTSIGASYLFWQPKATNSTLIHAAGYTTIKKLGLAAGVRYHTLGMFETINEYGLSSGTFTPLEYAFDMGLAYKIGKSFSVGGAFHYISSDMGGEKKGSAMAGSFSLLFHQKYVSIGLGCSYFGSKISYGYSEYDLPSRIQAGISHRFLDRKKHALTGVADVAYQLSSIHNGIVGGVGIEYTFYHLLSLRAGYHIEDKLIGVSYPTIGCGVHFYGFSIDFAYMHTQSNNPMYQTMIISLKWSAK